MIRPRLFYKNMLDASYLITICFLVLSNKHFTRKEQTLQT